MKCSQRDFNIFINTTKGTTIKEHMLILGMSAIEVRNIINVVGKAIITDWNATVVTPVKVDPTKYWYRDCDGVNKVKWSNINDIHALRILHNWLMRVVSEITIEFTDDALVLADLVNPTDIQTECNFNLTSHLFKDIKARANAERDANILKAVLNGNEETTMTVVGRLFNLSGTRIKDIVFRDIRRIGWFWKKKYNRDNSYMTLPSNLYEIIKKNIEDEDFIHFTIFTINELRESKDFFLGLLVEMNSPLLSVVSLHDTAPGVEVVTLPSHNKQMNEKSLFYLNSILNS